MAASHTRPLPLDALLGNPPSQEHQPHPRQPGSHGCMHERPLARMRTRPPAHMHAPKPYVIKYLHAHIGQVLPVYHWRV